MAHSYDSFNLKIQRFDENSLTSQSAEDEVTNVCEQEKKFLSSW